MNRIPPTDWEIVDAGPDGYCARFRLNGWRIGVIASWGLGWDHVSVSLSNRCPTWDEMCFIRDKLFDKDECVVQYHPPHGDYINLHPYCLHLWRPQHEALPMPPSWMVGPKVKT